MKAPVFVFLRLENFYQNHKDMVTSQYRAQLEQKVDFASQ
jgi:LEM3 (ligand-effect modulator 3) family / CDC50 family